MTYIGGSGPQVGVYANFNTTSDVEAAVTTYGWPGIAATAGEGQSTSPYTYALQAAGQDTTVDQMIENAYAKVNFWWLSVWTVSGPSASATNAEWKSAMETAASDVAAPTILKASETYGFVPAYVVLDLEGTYQPNSAGQAHAAIEGWITGLGSELTGALYINQSDFTTWDANSFGVPLFVAVDVADYTGPVTGSNIVGYMAFDGTCSDAGSQVSIIDQWGANMNTIQFAESVYTCNS
ncbi:hypothetical protein BM613_13650 [Sulfoacidibacillus thermotolerans]|uniref:Uncharacterized protein n=2 Tax=Sulfoacidibacillus thermotolerans TaxID=1765684 RepID=A0A2U3D076_SULT2|nr:hypothetical protein BM613_13650 [Sulfoacidibacillus thermotolerans]